MTATVKRPRRAKRTSKPPPRAERATAPRAPTPRTPPPQETEIAEVRADMVELMPYPAHGLCSFKIWIPALDPQSPERAWDLCYDLARQLVGEWHNACRALDLPEFRRATFDIWLGHAGGPELPQWMHLILASRAGLPDAKFLDLLHRHPATRSFPLLGFTGAQPVTVGACPEVRVADGTVAHAWSLTQVFLQLASDRYRRFHRLCPDLNDAYRQLTRGVRLPQAVPWDTLPRVPQRHRRSLYIFEVFVTDAGEKGLRVTSPSDVLPWSDAYDLEDQFALADVDICAEVYTRRQRLHHVCYVRPALRVRCAEQRRALPAWLEDDDRFRTLPEEECRRLFGVPALRPRRFRTLNVPSMGTATVVPARTSAEA